jgi:hypothetical protein
MAESRLKFFNLKGFRGTIHYRMFPISARAGKKMKAKTSEQQIFLPPFLRRWPFPRIEHYLIHAAIEVAPN